jgi:hypothetical protein
MTTVRYLGSRLQPFPRQERDGHLSPHASTRAPTRGGPRENPASRGYGSAVCPHASARDRGISHNVHYARFFCRRPIKMSPVCQLEMTLPGGFPGAVWGDGSADERSRAAAARGVARFGSAAADARCGGAALGVGAASGVSAVEGLSDRGSDRPNLETPVAAVTGASPRRCGASISGSGRCRSRI